MDSSRQANAYQYRISEKLRLFLPCLRQRAAPKQTLFAGPFAGEFGWELMQWQGFVRARRSHYQETHVLTYPGRDYLYEDCRVHHHDIDLKTAGYGYGLLSPTMGRRMATQKAEELGLVDYDLFNPSLLCTRYHKTLWGQKFRLLTEPPITTVSYDVLFHFRALSKTGPDQAKNYPPELARDLARRCLGGGLRIGCIGHPAYAYRPQECDDHRSEDLRVTVAAICSAHTVAGENSGPMHLANLCGKPTILWAQDQWRIDYSVRWNPFSVPLYIAAANSFQPRAEQLFEKIQVALQDLRQKSNDFTRPVYSLPAREIASY